MRYVGGKSKLAKTIGETILKNSSHRTRYIEPFIGGGSIFGQVAKHFDTAIVADLSPDLIQMWDALHHGWIPEKIISEAQYSSLRTAGPSPLRGLVGFGGSFGGKWFGGYARGGFNSDGTPRNHQWESARAAMRIAANFPAETTFKCSSYDTHEILATDVIYCDPPYASTQAYGAVGAFDSTIFWEKVREWAKTGAKVFVSEYQAPSDWTEVWSKEHRMSLTTTTQGRPATTERLFAWSENV